MDGEDSKKDLTSLVELSESMSSPDVLPEASIPGLEAAAPEEHIPAPDLAPISETAPTPPPMTDADFISVSERESPLLGQVPTPAPHPEVHMPESKLPDPPTKLQDFSELREFGEKIAIGHPRIEAMPAFSLFATGKFDSKTIKAIEDALGSEDFGIRFEDIAVQLSTGKLLVPRISEFAAITLGQKLRDVVDNIEIGLANEIYQGENTISESTDSYLVDKEHYGQGQQEVRDLEDLPQSEQDLFSTHLQEASGYQVTRTLSVLNASEVITKAVAENPSSKDFEAAVDRLTRELVAKAFKLGAHGVLGLNFGLNPIEGRGYRLLATGTAVKAKKAAP